MTILEKVQVVREFVNSHDGYPIVWLLAIQTIEKLNKAVKLIRKFPDLTLKEFRDELEIGEE